MTGWRWNAARVVFLVAVVAGTYLSWRGSRAQLASAFSQVTPVEVGAALMLVVIGLIATGWVWHTALTTFGQEGALTVTVPIFFVGQLGKYVPGSIWSFGAQAALASRQGIAGRAAVAASGLFLLAHLATGFLLAGLLAVVTPLPAVVAVATIAGLVGLAPPLYRWAGTRLAGRPCTWSWRTSATVLLPMTLAWAAYGLALHMLVDEPGWRNVATASAAFALAHAAGVLVPVAPAGLGAREAVVVGLLQPVLGTGPAAVVAVMGRLLHTVADFVVAGAAWVASRRG